MKGLFTLIATLFIGLTFAQGIEFKHDVSYKEILSQAKAEGKLVFMDCYTSWCGPCKRLSSQTFPTPEAGAYFNQRFVNAKFDMEQGEGPELAAKFGVRAYPTLLWIDPQTETVKHRAMGFMDPAGLIEQAKQADDATPKLLAQFAEKYKNGDRSLSFYNEYLSTLNLSGATLDTILVAFINKIKTDNVKDDKYNTTIYNACNRLGSPALPYLLKNKVDYKAKLGEQVFSKKLFVIADKAISDAVVKKDNVMFNEALKLLKDEGSKTAQEKIVLAQLDYSLRTQNLVEYDKYATQYVKKLGTNNDKVLNDIAWNYYINIADYKQLEKAKKWSYKAVNLKNTCENNTTYAYLNYKLGNLKEADLACDYALIKAKEEGGSDLSARALKDLLKKENVK
jgi:thiol-disulfide isomerase/thioredoxin